MKTFIKIALPILMLIGLACSHDIQKVESYQPPAIKFQPRLFYPKDALANAYYGTSKIIVQISKTGTVDKTFLIKSSGYKMLDSSAMEYCKEVVYTPAQKNGEFVDSRMAMNVKFNLSNYIWNNTDYINEVNDLKDKLKESDSSERIQIEKEILSWHNEFIDKMKDISNFNNTIEQVISPALSAEWKKVWNTFPLTFLLYHDFIQNCKDYNNQASVKALLQNALKCDIQYIRTTKVNSPYELQKRDNLLNKIKIFVMNNYPDIPLEELGFSKIPS